MRIINDDKSILPLSSLTRNNNNNNNNTLSIENKTKNRKKKPPLSPLIEEKKLKINEKKNKWNLSRPVFRPPTRNTCATSTPWSLVPIHHRRHGRTPPRRQPRRHQPRPQFKLAANCWQVNQSWGNTWRNCRSLRTTTGRPAITTITTTTREPCSETAAISRISKPRGSKRGRSNVHEPCLPGEFSKLAFEKGRGNNWDDRVVCDQVVVYDTLENIGFEMRSPFSPDFIEFHLAWI